MHFSSLYNYPQAPNLYSRQRTVMSARGEELGKRRKRGKRMNKNTNPPYFLQDRKPDALACAGLVDSAAEEKKKRVHPESITCRSTVLAEMLCSSLTFDYNLF